MKRSIHLNYTAFALAVLMCVASFPVLAAIPASPPFGPDLGNLARWARYAVAFILFCCVIWAGSMFASQRYPQAIGILVGVVIGGGLILQSGTLTSGLVGTSGFAP
jgi:FtsH-binding integral membrane protein